jgi:TonB family protein
MKKLLLGSIAALLAAAPAILPTAARACTTPNADARADAIVYEIPTISDTLGMTGTSVVKVSLNERGDTIDSTIFRSSGNRILDDAALRSARLTRFTPETRNCQPVGGTYLYEFEY